MFDDDLIEWTHVYVKNRDILKKEIIEFKRNDRGFLCKCKDHEVIYLVSPELEDWIFSNIVELLENNVPKKRTTIVCLNKKENLKFTIDNWQKLIKYQKLCMIFVNPNNNTKWMIIPFNHNKISEDIRPGLKTLFSTLEET